MPDATDIIAQVHVTDEAGTQALARELAARVRAGDVIALQGALGSGKTAFARALINAMPGAAEDVPSPTFTLVQTYARGAAEIWHFDLYRLEDPDEALELDIEDAFADGISLIEWPDRLGRYLPSGHLRVTLDNGNAPTARTVLFSGGEKWSERLKGLSDGATA